MIVQENGTETCAVHLQATTAPAAAGQHVDAHSPHILHVAVLVMYMSIRADDLHLALPLQGQCVLERSSRTHARVMLDDENSSSGVVQRPLDHKPVARLRDFAQEAARHVAASAELIRRSSTPHIPANHVWRHLPICVNCNHLKVELWKLVMVVVVWQPIAPGTRWPVGIAVLVELVARVGLGSNHLIWRHMGAKGKGILNSKVVVPVHRQPGHLKQRRGGVGCAIGL
mmetsp:Transcript_26202/g.60701  ORF Transcript_26202/g.60701 Transcript_26202/m.60701 type:complete len:228 (+) Transcript_26202:199-882(+)